MTIGEAKKNLRIEMKEALRKWTPEEIQQASGEICRRIEAHPLFSECRVLLAYYPLSREVDLSPLVERAWSLGKQTALPRMEKDQQGVMSFRLIKDWNETEAHPWGMREPREECPLWNHQEKKSLLLLPGLAFDRRGYRLGRGGGYYDRFLQTQGKEIPRLGVAFSLQVVDAVPHENHDARVSHLITEASSGD